MKKLELLVHISAPTSRADDEKYRRLAEAIDDFEATKRINCTAQDSDQSLQILAEDGDGNSVVHQSQGSMLSEQPFEHEKSRTTIAQPPGGPSNQAGNPEGLRAVALQTSTPLAETTGKTPIRYAAAPDFGSFTSTSRTPIQQIDEIERRWFQPQSSSKKRLRLSQKYLEEASRKGGTPDFLGDTQQALAALIDHVPTSSQALLEIEPWDPSPIDRPSQKRRRLSSEHGISRSLDTPKISVLPTSTNTLAGESRAGPSEPRVNDARVPGQPSQMPDSYGLSNSHSQQSTKGQGSWPEIAESAPVYFKLPLHGSQQSQNPADENEGNHPTTSASPKRASSKVVAMTLDGATEEDGDGKIADPQSLEPPLQSKAIQKEHPTRTAKSDKEPADTRHGFASLPIELWFPPPTTAQRKTFDELTETLKSFGQVLSPSKYFNPAFVSRPIKDDERGCWIIQTDKWKPNYQIEFWTELGQLVTSGRLGAVWCQRNVPQDWTLRGTDGKEREGLGTVWVFCWGQVVAHLWLAMLLHSHREIRKSQAQWTVGSPENLEVVVQMP